MGEDKRQVAFRVLRSVTKVGQVALQTGWKQAGIVS